MALGAGRLPAGDGVRWLRFLAIKVKAFAPIVEGRTARSAKATLLPWAAKAGLPQGDRRLLGSHARPGDTSVLEYSRDALAGPLRRLDDLLGLVRSGAFCPDLTRSGRWQSDPPAQAPPSRAASSSSDSPPSSSGKPGSSSSSDLSEEIEAAAAAVVTLPAPQHDEGDPAPGGPGGPVPPRAGLLRSLRTSTMHIAGPLGASTTACGLPVGAFDVELLVEWPRDFFARRRRAGCFGARPRLISERATSSSACALDR